MRRPPATSCSRYGKIDGLDMRDNVPPRRDAVNERRETQRFSGRKHRLWRPISNGHGGLYNFARRGSLGGFALLALKNWLARNGYITFGGTSRRRRQRV